MLSHPDREERVAGEKVSACVAGHQAVELRHVDVTGDVLFWLRLECSEDQKLR